VDEAADCNVGKSHEKLFAYEMVLVKVQCCELL
jgi:hypothetical protein